MGLLVQGLNKVRDFLSTRTDSGVLGTGTTQPTFEDTTIETGISGTDSSDVSTSTNRQFLSKTITFPSTNGPGSTVREALWKTESSGVATSRVNVDASVTTDLAHDNKLTTKWYVKGRSG